MKMQPPSGPEPMFSEHCEAQEAIKHELQTRDPSNEPARRETSADFFMLLRHLNGRVLLETPTVDYGKETKLCDAVQTVMKTIDTELHHQLKGYIKFTHGELKRVGSFHDKCKLHQPDEFDHLFVVALPKNFSWDEETQLRLIDNYEQQKNMEVSPQTIRKQFADCIDNIMASINLPPGLVHDGFKSPSYGGIRYCGPAVTILLKWDNPEEILKSPMPISIDITIAFKMPDDMQKTLADRNEKLVQQIRKENATLALVLSDYLIVPIPAADAWVKTSSLLEADLLHTLEECTFTRGVKVAKNICKRLVKVNENNLNDFLQENLKDTLRTKVTKMIEDSNKEAMRYGHTLLLPDQTEKYNELPKSLMSINSTAVKHLAFVESAKIPGSFSSMDDVAVRLLVSRVLCQLGEASTFETRHTFLDCSLQTLSISAVANELINTRQLAEGINEQLQQLSQAVLQIRHITPREQCQGLSSSHSSVLLHVVGLQPTGH